MLSLAREQIALLHPLVLVYDQVLLQRLGLSEAEGSSGDTITAGRGLRWC